MSTPQRESPAPQLRVSPDDRFRTLFDAAYDDLTRFVHRRVEPDAVDDVVSETFLVAWRRLDAVPPDLGEARAWLFGAARRQIATLRRGAVRQGRLALRVAESFSGAGPDHGHAHGADPADTVPARTDVARALGRLSDADAETLTLVAWDGLTSREAAAVLGITPTAFSVRLTRARRRLREQLADTSRSTS